MKTLEQTTDLISKEVIDLIASEIDNYDDTYLENIFFELFNSDYYIIGTYHARQWLSDMEAMNCIQIIIDWENEHFGKVHFNEFNNPEKVVNLTVYVIADTVWNEMLWKLGLEQDDRLTAETTERINQYFS